MSPLKTNKIKEHKGRSKEEKIKQLQEIGPFENVEAEIKEITQWVSQNPNKKLLIISPAYKKPLYG